MSDPKEKEDDIEQLLDMLVEQLLSRLDEIKYSDEKSGKTRSNKEYLSAALRSVDEEWGGMAKEIKNKAPKMYQSKTKSLLDNID